MGPQWEDLGANRFHAEVGIFKLNVHQLRPETENIKPQFIWEVSVPGICLDNNWPSSAEPCFSADAAKLKAEEWVLVGIGRMLTDMGLPLGNLTPTQYRLTRVAQALDGHALNCQGRPGHKGICAPPCPRAVS